MNDEEILKKVIEFAETKNENGYNDFIKTLSEKQVNTLQKTFKSVDNFLKENTIKE